MAARGDVGAGGAAQHSTAHQTTSGLPLGTPSTAPAPAHLYVDPDVAISESLRKGRDVLCFKCWQGNKSCALPGKGPGDVVGNPAMYHELMAMGNWRAVFSDMWEGEKLRVWGRTYRTHQHAFQSAKFLAVGLNDVADRFTVTSGDPVGQSPAQKARRSGNTAVKLTDEQWAVWETARPRMKDEIYAAKFKVGTRAAHTLVATRDALLLNGGAKKIVCVRLMQRRDTLVATLDTASTEPDVAPSTLRTKQIPPADQ
jgi:predicted NAD-dependent protein-ADP-ribosyltransferase YbiA (DUF1768 family)